MTPKERAVMQQALEALEKYADWRCTPETDQTITALREALVDQAEQELPKNQYNHKRIGWELERTAQGESYYGNALYVAMDLPFLNKREKDCLHRYMHGSELANDRFVLQDIAMKVYSEPESDSHPVRTKDLTDDEIDAFIDRAWDKQMSMPEIIRAVIAADREKNK